VKEVTRAQFLRRGVAAAGGLALLDPLSALAGTSGQPKPIPGGLDSNLNPVPANPLVHVLPPGLGFESSTIGDFNGALGAADIEGTAHGSDGSAYDFDCDMRFMRGVYIDTSGRVREGSFGFI
jgi:hypothetical protein